MTEYPIARLYADARVLRIYGGANEVMKELIARSMERERMTLPRRRPGAAWLGRAWPNPAHALCPARSLARAVLRQARFRYGDAGSPMPRRSPAGCSCTAPRAAAAATACCCASQNCPQFVVADLRGAACRRGGRAGQSRCGRPTRWRILVDEQRRAQSRSSRTSCCRLRRASSAAPARRASCIAYADAVGGLRRDRAARLGRRARCARSRARLHALGRALPRRRCHRPHARPRRPGRAALHLGHHRPPQGLHAHPRHGACANRWPPRTSGAA